MDDSIPVLRDAARRLVREFGFLQERHIDTGLQHAQIHILLEVEKRPTVGVAELATILNMDLSAASRLVGRLVEAGHLRVVQDSRDLRRKPLSLTARGIKTVQRVHEDANRQVGSALELMRPDETAVVVKGMRAYAKALERVRLQRGTEIREIKRSDNDAVAAVIVSVMSSFGAVGEGYSIEDAEVRSMYESYRGERCRYFVVEREGRVVGGGGVAPLANGDSDTCELKKMYFLPEARGLGLGQRVVRLCLDAAREFGFEKCYLETLDRMDDAVRLYEGFGFEPLAGPMGNTGHFRTNKWYLLRL